jgi:hypothetical protein
MLLHTALQTSMGGSGRLVLSATAAVAVTTKTSARADTPARHRTAKGVSAELPLSASRASPRRLAEARRDINDIWKLANASTRSSISAGGTPMYGIKISMHSTESEVSE